jgi:hypothetical protein
MQSNTPFLRLSALALGSLGAIACGGGPVVTPIADAGPIHIVDSGELPDSPDAYVAPDAGDGVCGDSLSPTGWAPMPDTCMPRCTHETAVAVAACPDQACENAATHADTTPSVQVRTQGGYLREVNCGGSSTVYSCIEWQAYSCMFEQCPDGYTAWVNCLGGGGACTEERTAAVSCAQANPGWMACYQPRVSACFDL